MKFKLINVRRLLDGAAENSCTSHAASATNLNSVEESNLDSLPMTTGLGRKN